MSFIFQKNGDYLVFYAKNQKRAFIWGIRQDELSLDSPPVYHRDDEQIWQKEHGMLSDFCILWQMYKQYLACLITMNNLSRLIAMPKL